MKAPDKVYIDDLAVVNDCVTKVSLKQLPNFSEYIRKDALLEWAKEHQEGEWQGSYTWSCYQIFIDKLNEM